MNKLSISLISTILLLSACSGGSQQEANNNPSPNPPQNQVSNQEKSTSRQEFTEQKSSPSSSSISGLIPSTNPQARLTNISQGKGDPFSSIKPPSVVKVAPNNLISKNLIDTQKAVVRESSTAQDNGSLATTQDGRKTPLLSRSQSFDAEGILVSGILDLQGENVALVTTPWDGATRSVKVGDIISDSSGNINVQVKDIAFNDPNNIVLQEDFQIVYRDINNPSGVVVLEQNGQIVRREVIEQGQEEENLENL